MLPGTTSRITAPISRSAKAACRAAVSLKGSTRVAATSSSGTPAESSTPWVRAPEPARTSMESKWPW